MTNPINPEKPAEPTGFTVTRESSASSIALLKWTAPKWRGYGAIDAYEIVYRAIGEKESKFEKVPADHIDAGPPVGTITFTARSRSAGSPQPIPVLHPDGTSEPTPSRKYTLGASTPAGAR